MLVHGDDILTQSAVNHGRPVREVRRLWLGENDEERREILRWTIFDNQKVSGLLGPLRFLRTLMKTGETDVVKWLDGRSKSALAILDKHFAKNDFAIGKKPTSADFSLCSYLFYEGELGIDLEAYPNVTKWLGRIKALPGWKHPYDLMPGHPFAG